MQISEIVVIGRNCNQGTKDGSHFVTASIYLVNENKERKLLGQIKSQSLNDYYHYCNGSVEIVKSSQDNDDDEILISHSGISYYNPAGDNVWAGNGNKIPYEYHIKIGAVSKIDKIYIVDKTVTVVYSEQACTSNSWEKKYSAISLKEVDCYCSNSKLVNDDIIRKLIKDNNTHVLINTDPIYEDYEDYQIELNNRFKLKSEIFCQLD